MSRVPRKERTEARDFLERPIDAGDWIVYPTGGTSARMVLAKVKRVEPIPESQYRSTRDGFRGPTTIRLVVNRWQEGTEIAKAEGDESWFGVDTTREVRVDQLHRVIKVTDGDARFFIEGSKKAVKDAKA